MSNSIDLRVNRSLELLERIVQTGADFVKKEEQLTRSLSNRRYGVVRHSREALEKIESRLADQIASAEAHFSDREATIRAIHESRSERIERAHLVGLRELPRRAQEARERWMGDLQMRQFNADRRKTSGHEAAKATLDRFDEELGVHRTRLLKTQRQAWGAFFGYWLFLRMLRSRPAAPGAAAALPGEQRRLLGDLEAALTVAEKQVHAFRRRAIPALFRYLPLPLLALLVAGGCGALAYSGDFDATWKPIFEGGGAIFGAIWLMHLTGFVLCRADAKSVARSVAEAWRLHDTARAAAAAAYDRELREADEEHEHVSQFVREQWQLADSVEETFAEARRAKLEAQGPRAAERNEELLGIRLERITAERDERIARAKEEAEARTRHIVTGRDTETAKVEGCEVSEWEALVNAWQHEITPLNEAISALNANPVAQFPPWTEDYVAGWKPPTQFPHAARFGRLDADLAQIGAVPKSERLPLPCDPNVVLPLALAFPTQGSLLFETAESGSAAVLGTMNNIILRLLCTTPPGKLSFTIIDPVGLGESFAGLMQLSDFEESLINRRIWTQRDQIESRLAELGEHIEKVIQMYLRNQYATITEYNEQAGSVAEKYHFVVVADFPAGFSELAAKRLQSIAASGPRCGVFTLIHWDTRQPSPDGFVPDELRKNSVSLRRDRADFVAGPEQTSCDAKLTLDLPPKPELAMELTQKIGKASIDSNRVEVPFTHIAPTPEEMWTNDTTHELKIAIGRTGATKLQYLAIGKGTRQHALFAGKTGSGKSTLFHVIVTNLALACGPDQVEFYLIDFKKGVEFKCYAEKRLPHARVVAIESDREFGLSVLQRVDEELKRRGELFRALGVQDVAGYRRAGGSEPIPRSLLIIDEFQEFFVEDDAVSQAASVLFDRIVRQGRAFGIHVLLGSQTLGGAYSLARATLGQMSIRVALQCNEADAYLIMDDTNSAPRLLSRPGEGIYNDAAGALEGNSPFQVVWLPDEERDAWLDKVAELDRKRGGLRPSPIVFEGNAPADVRENDLLRRALANGPTAGPAAVRAWLGAPNSIKGPTEAVFHRQSGNNLLVIGQRDDASLAMLGLSMLAVAAQHPAGSVKLVLFDGTTPDTPDAEFLDRIVKAIPHEVTITRGSDAGAVMNTIAEEMKARAAGDHALQAERWFVFIHGIQRFKKLKHEDDFSFSMSDSGSTASPGAQFNDLICEGPSHGMHVAATIDTFNNINRFMSRKALTEFEMRVVFQMSANDSASLIDSPKAGTLGLHRAIFYNEHDGVLETFRPYSIPDVAWVRGAAEQLASAIPRTASPAAANPNEPVT